MVQTRDRGVSELVKSFQTRFECSLRTAQRHKKNRSPEWVAFVERPRGHGGAPNLPEDGLFGNKDSPVDLDALAGSAGLEVKQAQVLVEAAYNKLKFYYGQGEVEQIQVWQATWGKANEALRKALLADKDIQSARGDSIPRDQARQEWVKVLETLRVMRRSVWNRVKAQLPDIPPDLELKIRTAVAAEMEKEEKVLRTLNELKEPADADARLIAA